MTQIKSGGAAGQVRISDEVIAIVAGTAVMEAEGAAGTAGNLTAEAAEKLGKRSLSKGVVVETNENQTVISINLLVRFGYKIQDVSVDVQKRVKNAVETMTGLHVDGVHINVSGV